MGGLLWSRLPPRGERDVPPLNCCVFQRNALTQYSQNMTGAAYSSSRLPQPQVRGRIRPPPPAPIPILQAFLFPCPRTDCSSSRTAVSRCPNQEETEIDQPPGRPLRVGALPFPKREQAWRHRRFFSFSLPRVLDLSSTFGGLDTPALSTAHQYQSSKNKKTSQFSISIVYKKCWTTFPLLTFAFIEK